MRFGRSLSLLAFSLATGLAAPLAAGALADAAAKAEAAIAAGDFDAWYAANETLLDAAWTAGGLHFGTLVATTGDATGYGAFAPRANTIYTASEPIHLYVEPRGYGYGDLGGGQFEIAFDIDLRMLDRAGTELFAQPDFSQFVVPTKAHARELMVNLTTTLDGAPPGDYTLEFTFRDRHSDQTAMVTNDITIK